MKKLVFALVLCLCASSLSAIAPVRAQFALADEQDDAAAAKQAEEEAAKKAAEEAAKKQVEEEAAKQAAEEAAKKQAEEEAARKAAEEAAKKQAEEEAAKQAAEEAAKKQAEEEAAPKAEQAEEASEKPAEKAEKEPKAQPAQKSGEKKESKEKEREYTVDLAGNGQFLLSELLKVAKADFRVGDVKAVEPENDGVAKLLQWKPDEKDKDDYVFTALADFKEAKVVLKVGQERCVLKLMNGVEYKAPDASQSEVTETPAPVEEEQEQTEVEKTGGAEAEAAADDESAAGDADDGGTAIPEGDAIAESETQAAEATNAEGEAQAAEATGAEGESQPEQEQQGGETAEDSGSVPGVEVPKEAEAWFKTEDATSWGTLAEIVGQLKGGETVYIQSSAKLLVNGAPLKVLSNVTLAPDATAFDSGYAVRISMDDPEAVQEPKLIEAAALAEIGEYADLYIWVEKDAGASGEGEADAPTLAVVATDYYEGTWSSIAPKFELSGIPEGKAWSYSAIIYNERFVPMSESVYYPTEQGQYALRFAMLDELGDIKAVSEPYTLWLDWTPPEKVSIVVDDETSYTLHITAKDSASGVEAVSLNGGKLWHMLGDGETYTYTGKDEKTFDAGAILIRDVAGNIYASEEDYTVEEVESDEEEEGDDDGGSGGGGGGGGDGSGTPALSHASGDGEEGSEYDALLLELPDEAMEQLTVGGESMDLTLLLEYAQMPEAPVGSTQPFTASLRRWSGNGSTPDTLVLNAELDANLGDEFTYDWRFNGEVYRLLANSGIKYIALKVGDDVAAFPTEGFTGGTRYTELKMQGVSTKKFNYTLSMKINLDPGHVSAMSDSDFSQDCDLSIRAAVEDTNYELSSSPKSIMYFYNVFLGPEDMMDQPFGEYRINH